MITILRMPTGNFPADECEWGFLLDDGGTPPIIKKLSYQLFTGAGDPVTGQRSDNYSSAGSFIHFGRIIENYLSTPFPGDPVEDVSSLFAEFYVRYGEIHIDTSDGTATEVGFTNTDNVRAYKSSYQYHHADYPSDPILPVFLTKKPTAFLIDRRQRDYIYVMTTLAETEVHLSAYTSGGSIAVTNPIATIPVDSAYAISVGLDNAAYAFTDTQKAQITRLVFEFKQSAVTVATYTALIGSDVCDAQVMFQEPIGGFSSIAFDTLDMVASRQVDTFDEFAPSLAYDLRTKQNGLHAVNGKSYVRLTLRRNFRKRLTQAEQEYYEGFAASLSHFLKYTGPGLYADDTYIKIIVENSEFKTRGAGKTEWVVTARFAKNLKALSSSI